MVSSMGTDGVSFYSKFEKGASSCKLLKSTMCLEMTCPCAFFTSPFYCEEFIGFYYPNSNSYGTSPSVEASLELSRVLDFCF